MLQVRGDGGYAEKAQLVQPGRTFPTLQSRVHADQAGRGRAAVYCLQKTDMEKPGLRFNFCRYSGQANVKIW